MGEMAEVHELVDLAIEEDEASEGELVPAEVQQAGGRDLDFGSNGAAEGAIVPATLPVAAETTAITQADEAEWDRILKLAQFAEASGLYPQQAGIELAMKAWVGKALRLEAATSFQALAKIRDGINISAELQRALARRAGYRIKQVELTYESCTLQLIVDATGEIVGETTYTLEDAGKAQLLGNAVWSKYRKNMLFARATTDLVSRFCPEVLFWGFGDPL